MKPDSFAFRIHGMDCAEEIAVLKREVGPLVGGESNLAFDLLNAKMIVSEGVSASSEAVLKAVARTGMNAEPWQENAGQTQPKSLRQRILPGLTALSGGLTALAFSLHVWSSGGLHEAFGAEGVGHVHAVPWFSKGAYLGAMIAACWFIAPKAWLSA